LANANGLAEGSLQCASSAKISRIQPPGSRPGTGGGAKVRSAAVDSKITVGEEQMNSSKAMNEDVENLSTFENLNVSEQCARPGSGRNVSKIAEKRLTRIGTGVHRSKDVLNNNVVSLSDPALPERGIRREGDLSSSASSCSSFPTSRTASTSSINSVASGVGYRLDVGMGTRLDFVGLSSPISGSSEGGRQSPCSRRGGGSRILPPGSARSKIGKIAITSLPMSVETRPEPTMSGSLKSSKSSSNRLLTANETVSEDAVKYANYSSLNSKRNIIQGVEKSLITKPNCVVRPPKNKQKSNDSFTASSNFSTAPRDSTTDLEITKTVQSCNSTECVPQEIGTEANDLTSECAKDNSQNRESVVSSTGDFSKSNNEILNENETSFQTINPVSGPVVVGNDDIIIQSRAVAPPPRQVKSSLCQPATGHSGNKVTPPVASSLQSRLSSRTSVKDNSAQLQHDVAPPVPVRRDSQKLFVGDQHTKSADHIPTSASSSKSNLCKDLGIKSLSSPGGSLAINPEGVVVDKLIEVKQGALEMGTCAHNIEPMKPITTMSPYGYSNGFYSNTQVTFFSL